MARLPNPFDGVIQAQMDRLRAQDLWREAVGVQNLEDEPVNRAPPVQAEHPWNIHHNDVVRGIEAAHWGQMQRAIPRPIRIAEVDDMQGKKYGEDYS